MFISGYNYFWKEGIKMSDKLSVGIITALGTIIVALITYISTVSNKKKDLLSENIVHDRRTWREKMRKYAAKVDCLDKSDCLNILSNINTLEVRDTTIEEYFHKDTHIKELIDSIDEWKQWSLFVKPDSTIIKRSDTIKGCLRLLLKFDWDRSKNETSGSMIKLEELEDSYYSSLSKYLLDNCNFDKPRLSIDKEKLENRFNDYQDNEYKAFEPKKEKLKIISISGITTCILMLLMGENYSFLVFGTFILSIIVSYFFSQQMKRLWLSFVAIIITLFLFTLIRLPCERVDLETDIESLVYFACIAFMGPYVFLGCLDLLKKKKKDL